MLRLFLAPGRNVHLRAAPHEVERNVQTDAGTLKATVSQTEGVKSVSSASLSCVQPATSAVKWGQGDNQG